MYKYKYKYNYKNKYKYKYKYNYKRDNTGFPLIATVQLLPNWDKYIFSRPTFISDKSDNRAASQ